MNFLIILIAIFIVLYIIEINTEKQENFVLTDISAIKTEDPKPYLWQFWDDIDGIENRPAYIDLCMETIDKHCSNSFNIIRLNSSNILDFIPEIQQYSKYIDKLIIAHKVDVYRMFLLYKYGGLYIDADVICMRDCIEIIDKLKDYDFVGFGCTGDICTWGKPSLTPSNWILCSRKQSKLFRQCLDDIIHIIKTKEKLEYHDIGKEIIWKNIKDLIEKENYDYYHYPNSFDGSRTKNGLWVSSDIVFSNINIDYDNNIDMLFYVFYNSGVNVDIKKYNKTELLNKDCNFVKYLKKSLSI